MPIPRLHSDYLPPGIYDCNLQEIRNSFGDTPRRIELVEKLEKYIQNVKNTGITGLLIINGSFVTSNNNPNDIDVVFIIQGNYPPSGPITSQEYEVISPRIAHDKFDLHLFVRINANPNTNDMINFFSGIRGDPNFKKGLLRISV